MFQPDYIANRHFGAYGGRYVPEMLIPTLDELESKYNELKTDESFQQELAHLYKTYVGRPTALHYAENLTARIGGPKIYLKLEGNAHTGAHKINNAIGQALVAKRLGKTRIIAETGAGQHGVATATVCAKLKFECEVYMGRIDYERQRPNVFWMEQMGAKVTPIEYGSRTLKDAVNAAMKEWAATTDTTHYLLGSALGPWPFPLMVRDFQSVIGREIKEQIMEAEGKLPTALIACVGGGSNASGMFYPFLEDEGVRLIGVEAGGEGPDNKHAIRFGGQARTGIVQAYKSYFLLTDEGQVRETHSISAGLDYPGVSPELAHLRDVGRIEFDHAVDEVALEGFKALAEEEGVIGALESVHAVGYLMHNNSQFKKDDIVVINISGRGDKDIFILTKALGDTKWKEFLKDELGLND